MSLLRVSCLGVTSLRVPCLCAWMVLVFVAAYAPGLHAGSVLDKVRQSGVIRCGGEPRPGMVALRPGVATGLFLDVCRAIGTAVFGPEGRFEFHQYDAAPAYDGVRDGSDDVFFLSASEVVAERLAGIVVPGPAVFFQTTAVMVAQSSPVQHLRDLAGEPICFLQGSNAHRHLEAWFAAHHLEFVRMGYQEEVELYDAYNVQVCHALASEVTELAEVRLDGGVNNLQSRILPEPLAAFPIMAATGTKDAEWAALVAWTVYTLMRAEVPTTEWAAGGLDALLVEAPELGLPKDWQKRVIAAVGTYDDIYRRNLGDGTPFRLPRGLNASWQDGGLLAVPYLE
jgi:general L-amino acid transport system substrate-binding protein